MGGVDDQDPGASGTTIQKKWQRWRGGRKVGTGALVNKSNQTMGCHSGHKHSLADFALLAGGALQRKVVAKVDLRKYLQEAEGRPERERGREPALLSGARERAACAGRQQVLHRREQEGCRVAQELSRRSCRPVQADACARAPNRRADRNRGVAQPGVTPGISESRMPAYNESTHAPLESAPPANRASVMRRHKHKAETQPALQTARAAPTSGKCSSSHSSVGSWMTCCREVTTMNSQAGRRRSRESYAPARRSRRREARRGVSAGGAARRRGWEGERARRRDPRSGDLEQRGAWPHCLRLAHFFFFISPPWNSKSHSFFNQKTQQTVVKLPAAHQGWSRCPPQSGGCRRRRAPFRWTRPGSTPRSAEGGGGWGWGLGVVGVGWGWWGWGGWVGEGGVGGGVGGLGVRRVSGAAGRKGVHLSVGPCARGVHGSSAQRAAPRPSPHQLRPQQ